jgi:hypothetical protein
LTKVRLVRFVAGAFVAFCVMSTYVRAQAVGAGAMFVAARGGANLIGNTYRVRETKPEPGGGVSVGKFLSRRWAVEMEAWMRAANPQCCGPRRREMLYSVSVIRPLTTTRLQPYMLGGLTFLKAADSDVQVQVGLGAQFALHRRVAMAVDLRGNGGGSTMIVRPTAALMYFFR